MESIIANKAYKTVDNYRKLIAQAGSIENTLEYKEASLYEIDGVCAGEFLKEAYLASRKLKNKAYKLRKSGKELKAQYWNNEYITYCKLFSLTLTSLYEVK